MSIAEILEKSKIVFCFDLEGVLMKNPISYYLIQYKPILTLKSIIKGFVNAVVDKIRNYKNSFIEKIIEMSKECYTNAMSEEEKYALGMWIGKRQNKRHLIYVKSIFDLLNKKGFEIYIITSADRNISYGFLGSLGLKTNRVFASEKNLYLSGKAKVEVIKNIKNGNNNKIIFVGDCGNDDYVFNEVDHKFLVESSVSYLIPSKSSTSKFPNIEKLYSLLYNLLEK